MIAGAPAGHLAGDPTWSPGLVRTLDNNVNNEFVTSNGPFTLSQSLFNAMLRDGPSNRFFLTNVVLAAFAIGNTSLNYEALYAYAGGSFVGGITLDPLLADPSAGLPLNSVLTEIVVGFAKFSSMAFPPFLRFGGFDVHMINKKERFDAGRCPNGN